MPAADIVRRLLRRRSQARLLSRSPHIDIHPSARILQARLEMPVGSQLSVGAGSIVEGKLTAERSGARIEIGENTFIGNSLIVSALEIRIGDDVLISWGCTLIDHHSHSTTWELRKSDVRDWYQGRKDWSYVKTAPISIGNKAWIGFEAKILAGVTVGEGAVVGCGSIVTRDVPAYSIVAGNPAQVIKRDTNLA